jgi:hypothetical protein
LYGLSSRLPTVRSTSVIRQAAAVVSEKLDEFIHLSKIGAVEQKSPFTSKYKQIRSLKLFQMKRECWGWNSQLLNQFSGRIALWAALYKQSIDSQAGLLGERA